MTYKIVKAVQTCWGYPSQWDAWTDTGQYLYLRYRHGCGTVEEFDDPDPKTWPMKPPNITFETTDDMDSGVITLPEFAECAGLTLALWVPGDPIYPNESARRWCTTCLTGWTGGPGECPDCGREAVEGCSSCGARDGCPACIVPPKEAS